MIFIPRASGNIFSMIKSSILWTKIMGFPCGSIGKESTCNARDLALIPGLERSPVEEKGYPLQYPVFHGLCRSRCHKESDTTDRLSNMD